jgi:hypothetical protein
MDWTKVVENPLGLVGYTLFLIFGLVAKFGPKQKWGWLIPVSVTLATIALVCGLALSYISMSKGGDQKTSGGGTYSISQSTNGNNNNVIGVNNGTVGNNQPQGNPGK